MVVGFNYSFVIRYNKKTQKVVDVISKSKVMNLPCEGVTCTQDVYFKLSHKLC